MKCNEKLKKKSQMNKNENITYETCSIWKNIKNFKVDNGSTINSDRINLGKSPGGLTLCQELFL